MSLTMHLLTFQLLPEPVGCDPGTHENFVIVLTYNIHHCVEDGF